MRLQTPRAYVQPTVRFGEATPGCSSWMPPRLGPVELAGQEATMAARVESGESDFARRFPRWFAPTLSAIAIGALVLAERRRH